jgi:hydrophobic/amphiphilic exporter-1 (mainly G- bacteria), HAE1 family
VVTLLSSVPGLKDSAKSVTPQQTEVHVVVDRQRATDAGISATTVGSTIRAVFQSSTATTVEWEGRRTDVIVQMRDEDLTNADVLMNLPVTSPGGIVYPLSALTRVEQGAGPTVLSRQDRQEQVVVGANLEGTTLGEVRPGIEKAMSGITLPAGVTWYFSGQAAQTTSAFSSLIFALLLGLLFVYMVLASQFGSFIHPFTVMAALPLAAIGAIFAMLVTHTELTIISMIGLILMMGMATKNSILLVDFIIRYRKEGQERREAILNAAPVRLRPILMTTFAIMLGMIPTAVGMGAAGAFRAPMAIAVIGGVFSSTLFSLVVVPVVYTYIDDVTRGVAWIFHRNPEVIVSSAPAPDVVLEGDIDRPFNINSQEDPVPNKIEKPKKPRHWPFGKKA